MLAIALYLYFLAYSGYNYILSKISRAPASSQNNNPESHNNPETLKQLEQQIVLATNTPKPSKLATTTHIPWAQLFLAAVLILSLSIPNLLTLTQQRGSRQNDAYNAIVLNKLIPLIFMACYACLFKSYNDKTQKLNAAERMLFALGTLLIPSFLPANARSKLGHGYPSFEYLIKGLSSFLSIKIPSSCAAPAKALLIAGPLYYANMQANKLSSPKQAEVLDAQKPRP